MRAAFSVVRGSAWTCEQHEDANRALQSAQECLHAQVHLCCKYVEFSRIVWSILESADVSAYTGDTCKYLDICREGSGEPIVAVGCFRS